VALITNVLWHPFSYWFHLTCCVDNWFICVSCRQHACSWSMQSSVHPMSSTFDCIWEMSFCALAWPIHCWFVCCDLCYMSVVLATPRRLGSIVHVYNSPPCFLAECHKRRLNRVNLVCCILHCLLFWVVFNFFVFSVFLFIMIIKCTFI